MAGKVVAVCLSARRGEKKGDAGHALLVRGHGLEGDAHAGNWHRQVSLLASESIARMRSRGLDVGPGDFAENITTCGIDLLSLEVGQVLAVGEEALLEITQKGKVCHERCAIYYQAGDCVMPREGVFARVLRGGAVRAGDRVEVISGSESGHSDRQ